MGCMKLLNRKPSEPTQVYRLSSLLSFGAISRAGRRPADVLVHVGDESIPRRSRGVRTIRSPFADGNLPPGGQLEDLVSLVYRSIQQGRSVHVTCDEGRNRSALICGLALHRLERLDGPAVIQRLVEARLAILTNLVFRKHLQEL